MPRQFSSPLFYLPFLLLLLLAIIDTADGVHNVVDGLRRWHKVGTAARFVVGIRHKSAVSDEARKRNEYIEQIMTPYGSPEAFSRVVKIGNKNGGKWLVSKDKSMQAILDFVQEKLGREHPKLEPLLKEDVLTQENLGGTEHSELEPLLLKENALPMSGCHVSFHFDPRTINQQAFRFDVGTRVSEEAIEHLELFEERETGRKMIINKEKKWNGLKDGNGKGEVEVIDEEKKHNEKGKNIIGMDEIEEEEQNESERKASTENEIAKKDEHSSDHKEEEDDDDDDDDDEEATIPLNTYASIGAIQHGKEAFGEGALLDMSNIPKTNVLTDKRIIERVKLFFDDIINACDGKNDGLLDGAKNFIFVPLWNRPYLYRPLSIVELTPDVFKDTPIFREKKEAFDLDDFLKKMKANEGKMQSEEDTDMYLEDLNEIMAKMVNSVRAASDYERAEIKELAEKKKAEFEEATSLDHEGETKRLMEEKHKPYDFLKTVQFAINARPASIEFKKLTFSEYEELVALSEEDGWGKLRQTLNWLKIQRKLTDGEAENLLKKAGHHGFESELKNRSYTKILSKEELEDLKEAAKWPKLEEILAVPLMEKLDRDEYEKLMELGKSKQLTEFDKLATSFEKKGKLSKEESEKLIATKGDETKLKTLIEGMGQVHRSIADNLIHGKKHWVHKTAEWTVESSKKMGKSIGNGVMWLFNWITRKQSKEITSSEMEKNKEKNENKLKSLQKARREAIADAVNKIRQNRQCHLLSEPIRYAIYEEKEEEKEERNELYERKAAATQDLRARLGAQAMNAVLNTKRFPEGHGTAVAMSVLGSGSIGIFLDVLMIPLIILGATHAFGPIPYVGAAIITIIKFFIKPLLESTTPLVAETFDSAIIKQYLESLKGKKFWRGLNHFKKTLVEAFESGKIAALGSIFYNFSMLASFPGALPIQLFFNAISTVTSAAMVPIELMKTRDEIIKSLHYKMENGFFPKPNVEKQDKMAQEMQENYAKLWIKWFGKKPLHKQMQPVEARNWAYINWLEKQTWRTMEVEQSSRLAINSMGIGPIISSIVFLIMQYFQSSTKAPESLVSAVSVMFNSPTEMISMTGAIWGANNIGFEKAPWLLSTDEQKNGLIMGKIFAKSNAQMKSETGRFEVIEDRELYDIYNPWMAITMPIGKFFVKSSIWAKEKWDKFSQRHEFKRDPGSTKTGNRGLNPKKLIVENYRKNVVYLITFPRTSSLPTLSAKSMALEYWLKMQKDKKFYRIADGFFIPDLFADSVPYVEYNGEKLKGSTQEIIDKILGNKAKHSDLNENKTIENFLTKLESALVADRKKHGMEFMLKDKALLTSMMSTMSQLFPKLVEYELDYVDSWDTLPGQLKGAFNLIGTKIDEKLKNLEKELSQQRKQKLPQKHDIKETMDVIVHILEPKEAHHKLYLAGTNPTYLDGFLFGLLTQFFETPLSTPELNEYFAEHKKSNTVLWKYYNQIAEEMTGGHEKWGNGADDEEEALPLNFDLMPAETLEKEIKHNETKGKNTEIALAAENGTKKNHQYHFDTLKYEGPFKFKFVRSLKHPISQNQESAFSSLMGLAKIAGERPVPVGSIKEAMRATKVNHSWLGPLWKVRKEWGDEEFAKELERRVAEEKRERFVRHVHEQILELPGAEGNNNNLTYEQMEAEAGNKQLEPVMAAVVDRVLDVVWEWAKPMQSEMMSSIPYIDNLDKASHELGGKISAIVNDYVGRMSQNSGHIEKEADNHVYEEFVKVDKSREYFDKLGREAVNKRVDEFYDGELKTEIMELLKRGTTMACPIEMDAKAVLGISNKQTETPDKNIEEIKEEAVEVVERKIVQMEKPSIKELMRRVRYIFDQEASVHLKDAVNFAEKAFNEVEMNGKTTGISVEKHFEEFIKEIVKEDGKEYEPELHKCLRHFLKRQRDAIDYIKKNNNRIGTDKSRLSTQDRLFRLFDRFITMKNILAKNCPEYLELNLLTQFEPDQSEAKPDQSEASSSSSTSEMVHPKKQNVEKHYEKKKVKFAEILAKFDDKDLKKQFIEKRKELKNKLDELESRRKKKLDEVVSIYTFNERTKELVKAQIEASDLGAERDRIEARLGEEGADLIRIFLAHRIKLAEHSARQSFEKLRKALAAKMREIVSDQEECAKNLHMTLAKPTEAKCEEILKNVVGKYNQIKGMIDNMMHSNAFDKNGVKVEIDKKITEIEQISKEIGELYAKYFKHGKILILEGINSITAKEIRSKATLEKFKILKFAWEAKMSEMEAARKKDRMTKLLRQIQEDSTIWQPVEKGLAEVHEKIASKSGNLGQINVVEWKEKLSKLGDVPEGGKTAKLLAKLETIQNVEHREMIQEEIGKMYEKEVEQRRVDIIRNAKYPIAKGILHLAAEYLCEGPRCEENHRKLASENEGGLGKISANSNKAEKLSEELLPAVKKLVFYTINDFNENCVIREEILEQFGLPLEKTVMHAYEERPFWDTETHRAAEAEAKLKKNNEIEAKHEGHLHHGKNVGGHHGTSTAQKHHSIGHGHLPISHHPHHSHSPSTSE